MGQVKSVRAAWRTGAREDSFSLWQQGRSWAPSEEGDIAEPRLGGAANSDASVARSVTSLCMSFHSAISTHSSVFKPYYITANL